jgi:hypothetical protein
MGPSVGQHPDGTLTGCVRLGQLAAGRYTVHLVDSSPGPPTLIAVNASGRLQLEPASGPPGTRIHLSGDVPSGMEPKQPFLPQLPDHELVCWDGCTSGLGEWTVTSWFGTHFEGEVLVPQTPWRSAGGTHDVRPGAYKVQMACVPSTYAKSGCNGIGLEAEFTITGPAQPARTPCFRSRTDLGATWKDIALPPLQGPPGSYPSYGDLQLLPNGTLLAVAGGWNLLKPGASTRCSVNLRRVKTRARCPPQRAAIGGAGIQSHD